MADVVSMLETLVRMPTLNPGGNEPALAQFLASELSQHQPDAVDLVEVPRQDGIGAYVMARWGQPKTLLNAHIDTVPPNRGYASDPFSLRHDGEKLIGLGTADTKGAIAAILSVLAAHPNKRPKDVAILFSGDEEVGSSCMQAFLKEPMAQKIARAVVCEPTGCRVGIRHRGIVALEATMEGPGGHSSLADDLPAPLASLAKVAVALFDWGQAERQSGPTGFTGMCMNIGELTGGVAFNVIPSEARLAFSVRPPPLGNAEAVRDQLSALVFRTAPEVQTTTRLCNPSFQCHHPEAFVSLLGQMASQPIDLAFWTEAALLAQAGIDAVVFGPGDIARAHAPNEWVTRSDLNTAEKAFARVIYGPS